MKTIFTSIISLLVILSVVSCAKDDGIQSETQNVASPLPKATTANSVTIMYYGAGGGNLDYKQIWKIRQCAHLGVTDKVNMTFQYKFSKEQQNSGDYANYHGVLRMDLADASSMKGCEVFKMTKEDTQKNLNGLPFQQYSTNSMFDMSNPQEIANFIRWSATKHPAEKYVLIFANHGGGWDIQSDEAGGKRSIRTRGVIYDDNIRIGNTCKCVSAKDVVEGIKKSGANIEVLYMDACLMSTWENLYEYKQAPVKYVVSSMEVSLGGDYNLMLSEVEKTPADLRSAFVHYIDSNMAQKERYTSKYLDMGIYDLSGIGAVTPIIQELGTQLKNQLTSTDAVAHTAARTTFQESLIASYSEVNVPNEVGEKIVKAYRLNKYQYEINSKTNQYRLSCNYVSLFLKNYADQWNECSDKAKQSTLLYITNQGYRGISLGDMLNTYQKEWNSSSVTGHDTEKATASRLYKNYINDIKSMAYINCTHKTFEDQPYVELSPTLNVMALNKSGWIQWRRNKTSSANINIMANNFDLNTAISLYSRSTFAQETGWCEVLKTNPYNPSPVNNSTRMTRYYGK